MLQQSNFQQCCSDKMTTVKVNSKVFLVTLFYEHSLVELIMKMEWLFLRRMVPNKKF